MAQQTQSAQILRDIDSGLIDERHFQENYPAIWLREAEKIRKRIQEHQLNKPETRKWSIPDEINCPDRKWRKIVRWMKIIRNPQWYRKQMHLWVWGGANLGKTSGLIEPLKERLHCYEIMKDEMFNREWKGPYDLAFCDEFSGTKHIEWLNEFLSSKEMQLRIPGGGFTIKNQLIPTIITSNHSIDSLYFENQTTLDALKSRFIEIRLEQFGNPFNSSIPNDNPLLDFIKQA